MNRPTKAPAPPQYDVGMNQPQYDHDEFGEVIEPAASQQALAPPLQRAPSVHTPAPLPRTGFGELAGAIAAVMAEIKPVEKTGWNNFHSYKYARMQDLTTELTPLMGKHGIVVFQTELERTMFDDGKVVAVKYQFSVAHKSGEVWPEQPMMTGMCRCRDSKGGFDDKSFNKCHTAARKYFLLSLFQIPTEDEIDADAEAKPAGQTAGAKAPPPPPPPLKPDPYFVPVIKGEDPERWVDRFATAISTSAKAEDLDQWHTSNAKSFKALEDRFPHVYTRVMEILQHRRASLAHGATAPRDRDPISSGPSDFPGDHPPAYNRQAPKPPAAASNTEWLDSLRNAFSGCEDQFQIAEQQRKHMVNKRPHVSDADWQAGVAIVNEALERVQGPRK